MNKTTKPNRKQSDNSDSPSNNLWVGNLSPHVTDSDLMSLFSKHGPVDSITSYPSRSYAFLYYRHVDDAKAALDALRGTVLRGSPLKIEFAKPAKPCKSLWVNGISQGITKEVLEEEFAKFGKIEDLRFLRDRNTAYVDYFRVEDAIQALKNMKGKRVGGDQIHVDFLRSHSTRRDQLPDHRDAREGQFLTQGLGNVDTPLMRHEAMRNYYEPNHSGPQRQQFHSFGGQRGDGPPTNVLMICYPTNVEIDERMLHNAMILFGEIESLKSFSPRHCAFVEFRSMDEARRAKEGLQGRLFNDPRIMITYSSNELAPAKDYPDFYPGGRGTRPNMYNELPFQPAHMDMPNASNALSRYSPSGGIHGPMRPFGPPGSFAGPEFKDPPGSHKFRDAHDKSILGAPGALQAPSPGLKRPSRPGSAPWNVSDDLLPGEPKRSRIDAALPPNFPYPSTKMEDREFEQEPLYRHGSRASQDVHTDVPSHGCPDRDYIWRGLIAKGGNPVCRARCVPIGKGIESEIPEVVNCSARTGLDMLTKHYAEATGFDVVFFLPDCEEDFASYTEFLNYLGGKDRAGVARFDNGTTLFLVPPSDFLTQVLKISGPPRLYGVVLKFPQDAPVSNSVQSQMYPTSGYMDGQARVSQGEFSGVPQNKVGSLSHLTEVPSALKITTQPFSSANTAVVSQAGVSLTPELIASLTSLLPGNSKSSVPLTAPLPPGGPSLRPLPANYEFDKRHPQGWATDRQDPDQTTYHLQQAHQEQYNPHQQVAQHQNYTAGPNMSYYQPPFSSFGVNPQSGQHAVSSPFNRQHQNEVVQSTPYSFGMAQGTNSVGSYGSSVYPQVSTSSTQPSLVHGNNIQQTQTSMIAPPNKENSELLNKFQQHQTVNGGPSQETAGVEADKSQRYQSTLQFAANLLLQIQQQQAGSKPGQGSAKNN